MKCWWESLRWTIIFLILLLQSNNQIFEIVSYPWPIFSILAYFLFGSPTLTIVRNFSKISSSLSFFLRAVELLVLVFVVVDVLVLVVLWFLFLSRTVVAVGDIAVPLVALIDTIGGVEVRFTVTSSTGLVYCRKQWLVRQYLF